MQRLELVGNEDPGRLLDVAEATGVVGDDAHQLRRDPVPGELVITGDVLDRGELVLSGYLRDRDDLDTVFSNGDELEISFNVETDTAPVTTKWEIDKLLTFCTPCNPSCERSPEGSPFDAEYAPRDPTSMALCLTGPHLHVALCPPS